MRIRPFVALRPPEELVAQVASPPYDVITRAEAAAQASTNPYSFLHVIRPDADLPPETGEHDDIVYQQAADALRRFRQEKYLVEDPAACIYLYRQRVGQHAQHGLVAGCRVDDYEAGLIKKHERTRPDKEADRARHMETLHAHAGPAFLTYRDDPGLDAVIEEKEEAPPCYRFTTPDGVEHTVWRVEQCAAIVEAFAAVEACYVADGHHRTAAAARVAREARQRRAGLSPEDEVNWFPAVLFPASQLRILPYNRVVRDLGDRTPATLLEAIRERFTVEPDAPPAPASVGRISVYLDGRWYGLSWPWALRPDLVSSLDVSVLQDRLLGPLLGIDDPRTSERIEFVGGVHPPESLARRVDAGEYAAAFSMFPISVAKLMAISDADEVLPPKSTWFEPKLRSGIFVHRF